MDKNNPKIQLDSFVREAVGFFIETFKMIIRGLKNFWVYVLLTFLLFGVIFFFKSRKTETYYISKASFTFNFVHKKVYGDMFFYLEGLAKEGKTQTLSKVLNVPEEIGSSLLSIEAKNLVNSPLHEDFTSYRVPFYLHLKTTDIKSIAKIEKALISYVLSDKENNKLAKKEFIDFESTLSFVDKDINRLDSIISGLDTSSSSIVETFNLLKERQKEKVALIKRLSDTNTIALLSTFRPNPVTKLDQNKQRAKKYMALSVFLSLLFVTFMQWYHFPKNED